ncbi:5-formyltetrahydrofolate cyclo-ligase [Hymenobacter busanensis]|uniref:5-formyltetrahydrofolate cyclo-ligase n=1 Tax=Hymenobacter busanensis TaxID=2607656 RepID=A0A7L4ZY26_9BACT|nr:5-formyltetrahydrofolate cyclo-ligase [Hymenobacter busanensis]KAA9333185.1 5-formyltetrahydrofolate cyclo-ligase [Hymenobacter busanensis]QHJ08138.1 5-formyltetrahydrofolate cyclo-ligase [Hymenobacter busanensis]
MLKADLRRAMLGCRRALPAAELAARSAQVADQFFRAFEVAAWRAVHVFLPILRQHELDTWLIIRRLWAEYPALRVVVPVTQPNGRLSHQLLTPDTALVENAWGIPEPVEAPEVDPVELDAVLVPLLAFDEQGQRVGYGKGFYDRFLLDCRPDALRIGLSLEPPVPRIADAWPGDVRLHACVTPTDVWRFAGADMPQ